MCGKIFCSLGKTFGGCEKELILPTDYKVFETRWQVIKSELDSLGLKPMVKDMPDYNFYYTDLRGWQEVLPFLTYPALYYTQQERKDCDDYSKKASADSSFNFGLNCLQVWGNTPYGYHAFNLVKADKWRIFEPNAVFDCAGELMDLENKYNWIPDKWKP